MKVWLFSLGAVLLAVYCCAAQGQIDVNLFSKDELAWTRAHPLLKLGLLPNQEPFSFKRRGGAWMGIGPEYIKLLRHQSGLKFEVIALNSTDNGLSQLQDKDVDLVPLVRSIGMPAPRAGIRYSTPYFSVQTIVATTARELAGVDGMSLDSKTIVLPAAEDELYRPVLQKRFKNVRIVISRNMEQALVLLSKGDADVAIGSEAQLRPDLRHQHDSALHFVTLPVAMTSDVRIAMRESDTQLASIVNKILASVAPAKMRLVRQDWLGLPEQKLSPFQLVAQRYSEEATLGAALLFMIVGLAFQIYREHQRAVRSERKAAMFLAVMSHEIRSPMNAVLAAVELLRFTSLDVQQRYFVDLANGGATTLLQLLDNVLDISKLEAGQLTLSLDAIDVVTLANDVVALQQLRAREKGITLEVVVPQTPPALMLDESRLLQVLHNLVSNAIKFTDSGGVTIQITLHASEASTAQLEIAVCDTGIGIAPQAQKALFQPFAQVAGTYKRSGGTGLGLVICRELADLMHGTLSLVSTLGQGTRVTLMLPADIAQDHAISIEQPCANNIVSPEPARRLSVLVVEDLLANQAVLRAQLSSLYCDTVMAGDGATALDYFSQREYDLVLMDCDLPDVDGYSLAAEWRRQEAGLEQARCPIIAISASTGQEHAERCFEAGMDGILSKPIRLAKLRNIIELWCEIVIAPNLLPVETTVMFGTPQVHNEIGGDIVDLLQAMILSDDKAALRAAHRLHGAALAMQWSHLALQAGGLESLLRSGTPNSDAQIQNAVQNTVNVWREHKEF